MIMMCGENLTKIKKVKKKYFNIFKKKVKQKWLTNIQRIINFKKILNKQTLQKC